MAALACLLASAAGAAPLHLATSRPMAPLARRARDHVAALPTMVSAGAAANYDGARIGPPPDLPSLLLHNRIVYVGTGLVPQVAELIVAQLLYLQFESAEKHYFMYINSPGTASRDGMTGFETDAFAIADTMRYIRPEAHTICLGMAYGTAAMLLATGAKGKRACLPNSVVMMHQPRSRTQGQAADIELRAREVLYNRRVLANMIAERSGQSEEQVLNDMARTKYLNARDCVDYGLVDRVLETSVDMPAVPTFLDKL